jgi:hypothetical protein
MIISFVDFVENLDPSQLFIRIKTKPAQKKGITGIF